MHRSWFMKTHTRQHQKRVLPWAVHLWEVNKHLCQKVIDCFSLVGKGSKLPVFPIRIGSPSASNSNLPPWAAPSYICSHNAVGMCLKCWMRHVEALPDIMIIPFACPDQDLRHSTVHTLGLFAPELPERQRDFDRRQTTVPVYSQQQNGFL